MTPAPKTPSYEAKSVRLDGYRRGSVTPTHEGYVPVCGRCFTRLAPRATVTQAEEAIHRHWDDARHRGGVR